MMSIQRIINARPSRKPVKKYSLKELKAFGEANAQAFAAQCVERKRKAQIEAGIGRSGILAKYQHCDFDNFIVDSDKKQAVVDSAINWLELQMEQSSSGGFIFAGLHSTGKNHLASAIAKHYIKSGLSALVITVSDLMLELRDTYRADSKVTEKGFMKKLSNLDLLVIDEIGVQRNTANEQVTLSTLIDTRYANNKPTGLLTNLDHNDLIEIASKRAVRRIRSGTGIWLSFDWPSFEEK